MDILTPGSPEELAEALAAQAARHLTIALGGAFSKNGMAGPAGCGEVRISTSALTRVLEYEPGDLTISVQAGVPWRDLTALLAGNRQMIPLDPPFAAAGTVGGVVAANLSGPRRRLFGTARDMVIGMKFATLEGKLVQSGGMVVKNVAGLDMAKLMIGSFGTLAAMAVINFKVTPAPELTRTFVQSFPSPEAVAAARDALLNGVLHPAALDVLNPAAAARAGLQDYCLLLQAGGSQALIDRCSRELAGAETLEGVPECRLWESVREFVPQWLAENPQASVVRFSHTLSQMGTLLEQVPAPLVCRAGSGVAYAAFENLAQAQAALASTPARGVIEFAPEAAKPGLVSWPAPGDDFGIMEKVKTMFDPDRLLNPGRLYGRL